MTRCVNGADLRPQSGADKRTHFQGPNYLWSYLWMYLTIYGAIQITIPALEVAAPTESQESTHGCDGTLSPTNPQQEVSVRPT